MKTSLFLVVLQPLTNNSRSRSSGFPRVIFQFEKPRARWKKKNRELTNLAPRLVVGQGGAISNLSGVNVGWQKPPSGNSFCIRTNSCCCWAWSYQGWRRPSLRLKIRSSDSSEPGNQLSLLGPHPETDSFHYHLSFLEVQKEIGQSIRGWGQMPLLRVCEWRVGGGVMGESRFPSQLPTLREKKKKKPTKTPTTPLLPQSPPTPLLVGPKKQLVAFNLGTYVNEVGN